MFNKRKQEEEKQLQNSENQPIFLRKKSIKELIAPSGIDASNIDHLEIISNVKRYAEVFMYQVYQDLVYFLNYLGHYICLEMLIPLFI